MHSAKFGSRGFTLIASLLLLLLLSGFALGLLMMVNTEQRVGGNDLQNQYTYRSAEGAIEKMTSDLANTFKTIQAPTAGQICSLSGQYPTWDSSVTYPVYTLTPVAGCAAPLTAVYGQIQAGPNAGLYAQIIPVTLSASAQRLTGEEVSMSRTVEVALIPVFQFGVFSDKDIFFGSSPDLTFAGRVHTNGDIYLGAAAGATVAFDDKISAYGNVVRNIMDNGLDATAGSNNDTGTVLIPNSSQGCAAGVANATCRSIAMNEGSVINGPTSAQNLSTWQNISKSLYNSYIIDGNNGPPNPNGTGATNLSLPFVNGAANNQAWQILRRPPAAESTTSTLGASRLVNEAQIRVMFSDKEADLHLADWNGDATQDVELATSAPQFAGTQAKFTINGSDYYLGESWCSAVNGGTKFCGGNDTSFIQPPTIPGGPLAAAFAPGTEWPLINGWLLVEAKWAADGNWHGVTKEWMQLGFARGLTPPAAPATNTLTYNNGGGTVTDTNHKNAILYLETQADRAGNGVINTADAFGSPGGVKVAGAGTQYNWYPINMYDAREGENWDVTAVAANTGTPNGIMNSVELDVGNLKRWLAGTNGVAGTGPNVDYVTENGYILYFSDRRGMQYSPFSATVLQGEYGFEDVVNYANNGVPNGSLEPPSMGKTYSPEDVNNNNVLDNYGVKTVGDAYGPTAQGHTDVTNPPTPYADRVSTFTVGRANRVTGARHVLTLVDGSLGNLPVMPAASGCILNAANPTGCGGFTVGSENPVYIQGNYNSSAADTSWGGGAEPLHSAAAIIADAVTLLSSNWQDAGATGGSTTAGSLLFPTNISPGGNRTATTTYYRVAIAGGKTIAFQNLTSNPTWAYGMDGGVHNFLRFLEDWTNQTLNYKGSLVSLYWNTYATGTFKCCNLVYHPPVRNYVFDPLFAQPQNLPPGTPMFRNVDNLSYRQNYAARTN